MFYREAADSASQVERGRRQIHKYAALIRFALVDNFSRERSRWILWSPVFFGLGILLYFQLTFEPSAFFMLATPLTLFAVIIFHRLYPSIALYYFLPLILCIAGFNNASIRSISVAAPILHKTVGSQYLEGKVVSHAQGGKGQNGCY